MIANPVLRPLSRAKHARLLVRKTKQLYYGKLLAAAFSEGQLREMLRRLRASEIVRAESRLLLKGD
jgi:hypothetical protein